MKPIPVWVVAFASTLLVQVAASFMGLAIPVIGPAMMQSLRIAPETIGAVTSLSSLGSLFFLCFLTPVLLRFGPVSTLQGSTILAGLAMCVAASGWIPLLFLAAFLQGISYGPSAPAGTRILAATAPPRHRMLIFSVKQAGVPMGGMLAGFVVAPLAAHFGWRVALVFAGCVGIAAALAITPARPMMDTERDRTRSIHPLALLSWRNVANSIVVLREAPRLVPLALTAVSLAVLQGCMFTFCATYLVARGLSLEQAGIGAACMQAAGVAGRIALGFMADRSKSPIRNLMAQGAVAAIAMALYGLLPQGVSLLTAAIASGANGFLSAGWNGIFFAEVARIARPERVAEATSASTLVVFTGYIAAPALFWLLVAAHGSWTLPFFCVGLQALVMVGVMAWLRRKEPAPSGAIHRQAEET